MYKPQSLLDHLCAAVPALRTAPDQISVLVRAGKLIGAGAASGLSFEYHYTMQVAVLDYSSDIDAITVALMAWVRVHQDDIIDNPERRDRAIRFEVDYPSSTGADIIIELDLTERCITQRATLPDGQPDPTTTLERWVITHPQEPQRLEPLPCHITIEDKDGTELADWWIQPERV